MTEAARQGKRVPTLSLSTEIRFASAEQRAGFARELERTVARLVGRYADPAVTADGAPAPGRLFRLVVGCYPPPASPPGT
jgi:hypothetical protein